jgi:hypothetical protein
MIDIDATSKYSTIIVLGNRKSGSVKVYPTLIRDNKLDINSTTELSDLLIFDTGGRQVYNTRLNGQTGYISVRLPDMPKGIYYVKVKGPDHNSTQKIVIQ